MDLKKRKRLHAYEPYKREALYCFCADLILVLCLAVVIILFDIPQKFPYVYLVFPAFFLLELVFNYSIFLLGLVEQRRNLFLQKQVRIQKITVENSFSGHWGSVISKLYPSQLMVGRYKLLCVDSSGEKLKLRSAMSLKKYQLLISHLHPELMEALSRTHSQRSKPVNPVDVVQQSWTVSFGKYTHIILSYDDQNELSDMLNRQF